MHLLDFSKRLKNEFEKAVVNESSVFKPLKFYCIRFAKVVLVIKEITTVFCFVYSINRMGDLAALRHFKKHFVISK